MTMKRTLLFTALMCMLARPGTQAQEARDETKLIEILESGAARRAKADACRGLTVVGSEKCVPVLVGLLGDEKLSHMARYALEPNPSPTVDEALRKALGAIKGRPLIGVIGSVGVRRDAAAVDALARLLGSDDSEVAQAAARALGRIGGPTAAKALGSALAGAKPALRPHVVEGVFRCAEALDAAGQGPSALAVYERLLSLDPLPHQVRTGALRGTVLAKGDAGLPLLVEALGSDDFRLVGAAARIGQEITGIKATEVLAKALGTLSPDAQVVLCLTLGKRADPVALPHLFALAKKGDPAVRVAAIRAVTEIGDPSAVPVLMALHADEAQDVAQAARNALAVLSGPEADAALVSMLDRGESGAKLMAIELIGRRRMADAVPALVKASADADESVRIAALKALGELGGATEFPALVDRLVRAKATSEAKACEQALGAICARLARPDASKVVVKKALYGDLPDGKARDVTAKVAAMVKQGSFSVTASNGTFGDPTPGLRKQFRLVYSVGGVLHDETVPESGTVQIRAAAAPPILAETLCKAVERATGKTKLALLGVLRSAGGDKALAAVRAATADEDPDVRKGAVAVLCGWPTPDVVPELMQLAVSAKSTRDKVLALRGCCRLVPAQAISDEKKAAQLKDILGMCERTDEKRLALSALGAVPIPEALAVVIAYLEAPNLREEACLAAVSIADAIAERDRVQATAAMRRVLEITKSKTTIKRARGVLRRTQ